MKLKSIRNWAVFLIVMGLILFGIIALAKQSAQYDEIPVTSMNIGDHQNIALHIHSNLRILIDGTEQTIPANVGISQDIMRPVHTHDSSGEIHIEGPQPRDFTVGEFFDVWGKTFNPNCIFEYCTENGTLEFTVNGQPNSEFENYVMRDEDQILIKYTSKEYGK